MIKPVVPTIISIIVQVLKGGFLIQVAQRFDQSEAGAVEMGESGGTAGKQTESSATMGMAATIPAAMVMATVAEPTETRTTAAIRKATTTMGSKSIPSDYISLMNSFQVVSLFWGLLGDFILFHVSALHGGNCMLGEDLQNAGGVFGLLGLPGRLTFGQDLVQFPGRFRRSPWSPYLGASDLFSPAS